MHIYECGSCKATIKLEQSIDKHLFKVHQSYEDGKTGIELVAHYDYGNGGIGSAGLSLKPYLDNGYHTLSLEVYSELDGHLESDVSYPLKEIINGSVSEKMVLANLYEIMKKCSIEFKQFSILK